MKRRGKSSPDFAAMQNAVRLMGCKVMYIGLCRAARPMPRGRPLKSYGDIVRRQMTNIPVFSGIQNPAYRLTAFLFSSRNKYEKLKEKKR